MYTKDSKVFVNFKEIGNTLVSKGKYSVAKVKITNGLTKNEVFNLITPSKVERMPVYQNATRNIALGYEFIEMALNLDDKGKSRKPKPPKKGFERWLRSDEGKLYQAWNKATDAEKIAVQLEKLANDIRCELVSFEISE